MDLGLAWEAIFGVVLFFVFLTAGLEILWSFVLAGAIIYMLVGFGIGDIPRIVYHNIDKEVLMAVAYFILAGGLTGEGGIADKLVVWVNDLIGWCYYWLWSYINSRPRSLAGGQDGEVWI